MTVITRLTGRVHLAQETAYKLVCGGYNGSMNNNKFLETWFRLECVGFNKDSRLVSIDGHTCDDVEFTICSGITE